MSKEDSAQSEEKQKMSDRMLKSRLVKSLISGVVITLVSLIIAGFNLSTNSGIKINDDVNRYFDTCVGEALTSSTPRIRTEERGFPLAYVQTSHVPICEQGVEIKRVSSRYVEFGAFVANVLFWTCVSFIVLRSYVRRKHIKINRAA